MATVRFSDRLKSEILGRAKKMFENQISAAVSSYDATWGDKIYDKLFSAEDIAKFNNLPQWAMATKDGFEFGGFYGDDNSVWQTAETKMPTYNFRDVRLNFASARPWPHDFERAPTGAKHSWRSVTVDFNNPKWEWLKEEVKNYTQRIFLAQSKSDKFVEGVSKLLQTYSTLAPALKAWPALWDLLDEETKDRHKKIVERTTRDIADVDVDLNSMTAAVTFNKITR